MHENILPSLIIVDGIQCLILVPGQCSQLVEPSTCVYMYTGAANKQLDRATGR